VRREKPLQAHPAYGLAPRGLRSRGMSARENILARIRAAQGKPSQPDAAERQRIRSHLAAHPENPRPGAPPDLVAEFRARALALSSTVDEVAGMEDVPHAVVAYLAANALARRAVCWPQVAGLEWRAVGLEVEARAAREGDLVGITGAYCAIAETGTLVTVSGPGTPPSVSLLPETHIAIVRAQRVVRGMEEAWRLMRSELTLLPRAINFISGPSRTADIEQTVTLGAHGPYRVHIVLVVGE
jgi:L-lactate dehydrogenase complex protein LldG